MPETMQAWSLAQFGLEHLRLNACPVPRPGPDELLVRVGAVSLNYRDKLVVAGQLLPEPPAMPFIPVSDFAGEVVEAGAQTSRFRPGDRLMGNFWTRWIDGPPPPEMRVRGLSLGGPLPGALAEYVRLPEAAAVPVPPHLSDAQAATLPIAGLTAWSALVESDLSLPGRSVLIFGTGGVALAALQIAAASGARAIVTSRSAAKGARAARLGAWATIDTTRTADWPARVLELTDGAGVDHVLETVGGDHLAGSLQAVAPEGRIHQVGFLAGPGLSFDAVPLMLKRVRLQGVTVGHRRAFERLARFVELRRLHPVIDTTFAFADAPGAFDRLDAGPFGKVVVEIAPATSPGGQGADRRDVRVM